MNSFPNKQLGGKLYKMGHLSPLTLRLQLNRQGMSAIEMSVTFGCHCFTEEFKPNVHQEMHRYVYNGELRAFDVLRHECSLQLPQVIESLQRGLIYNAQDQSYTYVAHIVIESLQGPQNYSVFFSLKKETRSESPALKMFVKSAYLKALVAKPNAQSWRFNALAGHISGAFPPREKKPKPQKKKAP